LAVKEWSSRADDALVSTIVMLCAVQTGFELPDIFVQESAFVQSQASEMAERFGTPRHLLRLPPTPTVLDVDACLDVLGQDGLQSSLQCYAAVGHAFALWNRHPKWKVHSPAKRVRRSNVLAVLQNTRTKWLSLQILKSTGSDVYQLDVILSSFNERKGESVAQTSLSEDHAISSVSVSAAQQRRFPVSRMSQFGRCEVRTAAT
jgi:hypothetical protein